MTSRPQDEFGAWPRRLCLGLFVAALIAHLACCLQGWHNLPVDGHEFRQTQTALSIRYLIQDGLRLDYETPLLGKPWAIPLEFPLYQGVVAVVARTTGLPLVQAGRLVGILAFYLSLPAFYLLLGRLGVPRARRPLLLLLLLSSPLYLFYTRAIMIESTALCLGAWFMCGFWALVADGRRAAGVFALVCGVLGAMVKLPALAGWLTAAAIVLAHASWSGRTTGAAERRQLLFRCATAALVLVGVVAAGLAWSAYTDSLKALNPLAGLLRSDAVARWGMGPVSLRFSPAFWGEILRITTASLLAPVGFLAFATLLLPRAPHRLAVGVMLFCGLIGPAVFATLYQVHDYYSFGTGIFLLGAAGLALERGFARPGWAGAGSWLLLLATAGLGFHAYAKTYYPMIPGNAHYANPLGSALRAITDPSDVIIIYGQDWNPVTPYFAERRALMFPGNTGNEVDKELAAFGNLEGERVAALVVTGPGRHDDNFVRNITSRFGLAPDPVLEGRGSSVFARTTDRRAAADTLRNLVLPEHTVPEPPKTSVPPSETTEIAIANLPAKERTLFKDMRPLPHTVRSQFGLGPTFYDGQPVFSAHPSTELVFTVPPGTRSLRAEYGLVPEAYRDTTRASDGVDFAVLLRTADGTTTRAAHHWLRPADRPEDRGVQTFDIALPDLPALEIVLRTGPGPMGNISFDWAFWRSVSIE